MTVSDILTVPVVKLSLGLLLILVCFGLLEFFKHSTRGGKIKSWLIARFKKWLRSWTIDPITKPVRGFAKDVKDFVLIDCLVALTTTVGMFAVLHVEFSALGALVTFGLAAFATNWVRDKWFS